MSVINAIFACASRLLYGLYAYMQEHLLIVCELLKANLYEFHKFNRESGGEVYFTMPRLQVCNTNAFTCLYLISMHC